MGVWQAKGEENANAKITADVVREIRALRPFTGKRLSRTDPNSIASIAARFGISPTQVSQIVKRRSWSHL